jgi:hypothetical protein
MNFRGRDESADATAALDDAITFERSESVARGHQTDLMKLSQVAFRSHSITGAQLTCFNALTDDALNSLVGGDAIPSALLHSFSL